MRTIKSTVVLDEFMKGVAELLQRHKTCKVFLDTNILGWAFRLSLGARIELFNWFRSLNEKLAIPAWVVHEYNTHLRRKTQDILYPYKRMGKSINAALTE